MKIAHQRETPTGRRSAPDLIAWVGIVMGKQTISAALRIIVETRVPPPCDMRKRLHVCLNTGVAVSERVIAAFGPGQFLAFAQFPAFEKSSLTF